MRHRTANVHVPVLQRTVPRGAPAAPAAAQTFWAQVTRGEHVCPPPSQELGISSFGPIPYISGNVTSNRKASS